MKVKLLYENSKMPTKAHESDACFDLYVRLDCEEYRMKFIEIPSHECRVVSLGIATEIPEGFFAFVVPRSSLGFKKHCRLSNSVGIIDSGYRGEWKASIYNDSDVSQYIQDGEKICQFGLLPIWNAEVLYPVDELSDSDRGEGGFGSSGVR